MARATAITGGALRRERLFALLDRATGKAIWISGPPGAGKSTLVSTWVEARRMRCLWHRAQAADGDLASFFYELGERAGRRRAPLPRFTPEYRGGEDAFARRFFRELARGRRLPWVLVIDDLHQVSPPGPLLAVLRQAIEELLAGATAVLVSREQPPGAFARLVANGVLAHVGGERLRLGAGEAIAIARSRAPRKTRAEIARLCERAAGWAAGLVLLATSPRPPAGGPAEPAALFQYLASELYDRVEPETRRILVDAAIPPTLPARIVSALCGSERAPGVLEDLAERAYFVARRGSEDPVYELHPLAREFLLERGRAERPPERLRDLRARAAGLLAEAGRVEDAIDLHTAAGAWDEVSRLALARAPHLAATGRLARLEGWLEALPPAHADQDPWLAYWRGICLLSRDPAAARGHLDRAWAGFDAAGDAAGLHSAFAAVVDGFFFEWADLRGMDEWIDRFEAAATRHPIPGGGIALRSAAAILVALALRRLGSEALPAWEQRALEVVKDETLPPPPRLVMGQGLLVSWALRGEVKLAAQVVGALAPIARAPGVEPLLAIAWLMSEAVHHWHVGSALDADRTASLGLEMARETGVHAWDYLLQAQRVYASLAAGDCAAARERIAALDASPYVRRLLHEFSLQEMRCVLARHEGDASGAVSAARTMVELASAGGFGFAELIASIDLALALVEAGDAGARPQLEALRRVNAAIRSALADMTGEMAEADLERRSGDPGAAREHLERGLRMSREKGIAPDIWFSRGRLAELCAFALDSGIETEHVLGLVRRLGLAAPAGCTSERWPWAVRARLLGPIEIAVRGAPLRFAARAQRRPLDVLAAAALAGERAPTAAGVAGMLWPDAEGDAGLHALETALYRLRRLVGEDVVRQRGGAVVLDRARCWTDVAALEAHLARGAARLQQRDPEGALVAAESAVALYRGPLLGEREDSWVLGPRTRLRSRLRRCLSDLECLGAAREAVRRLWTRARAADPEVEHPLPVG